MRYVSLGERVLATSNEFGQLTSSLALRASMDDIEEAESALVGAYVRWRDAIQALADVVNVEAKRVLEKTLWDLT